MLRPKPVAVAFTLIWWWTWHHHHGAVDADPQTLLLNQGCSEYRATNTISFLTIINRTLSELREEISKGGKRFGTAPEGRGEEITYAMYQCRNYLSMADCLSCFNTATTQVRSCSASIGARVIYDGCFLRHEDYFFYSATTLPGNGISCGNKTAEEATTLAAAGKQVLMDLQIATPKTKGFFAATKTQVGVGNGSSGAIYAVAQCVETATEASCLDCLTNGYNNLQACLPNTDGRAYDAGCFMRYSQAPFFADNQTIDITPYLKQGMHTSMLLC